MNNKLSFKKLANLYLNKNESAFEIAKASGCSENKINYWLHKYAIQKRTISEAIYIKHNPAGDPFKIKNRLNKKEVELKGLGLGIYWGEGDKSPNNTAVRVGNTDPFLIKKFREFLRKIYRVKEEKFFYGLILFNDIKKANAVEFWEKQLGIKRSQLGKITIIPPQGKGTYKKKSENGVLILGFTNKKLKEQILNEIKKYK
ncbi:MAG: hypothetical protein PHF44_03330 [Candidatus Pacebacteria bacterium]|nr:hypothetical protein [Candidatus Paceibacterota bacterium]